MRHSWRGLACQRCGRSYVEATQAALRPWMEAGEKGSPPEADDERCPGAPARAPREIGRVTSAWIESDRLMANLEITDPQMLAEVGAHATLSVTLLVPGADLDGAGKIPPEFAAGAVVVLR